MPPNLFKNPKVNCKMKVDYFKEKMSGVQLLLSDWQKVTNEKLNRENWIIYLRGAAGQLSALAGELERDLVGENK